MSLFRMEVVQQRVGVLIFSGTLLPARATLRVFRSTVLILSFTLVWFLAFLSVVVWITGCPATRCELPPAFGDPLEAFK